MNKHGTTASVAGVLVVMVGCTVSVSWPGASTEARLNEATGEVVVSRSAGDSAASVVATIVTAGGATVELDADQAVRVNETKLQGPNAAGQYTATVDAADSYEVAVLEPTRGEEYTTIGAPADFTITAPGAGEGASLSGFTLTWSGADANLQVTIELSQMVFGAREVTVIGPVGDTGSRAITVEELRDFVQGVDLTIKVTKTARVSRISGFASGVLSAELAVAQDVQPRP